jgi:dTDP-4-amino-4,6-dideoxygalactose transaminase
LAKGESPLCHIAGPSGRLAAVLTVHQVGMPSDLQRILPLCQKAGVPLIEDAAPALGSQVSLDGGNIWDFVGRPHGLIACFSFHPRKPITTGEGGMLTTADAELDQRFRLLRHHGMALPDYLRHSLGKVEVETYLSTGFNYRMSDILAAVGLAQMDRLEEIVLRRKRLAEVYREELRAVSGMELPIEPTYARSNWQSYILVLDDANRRQEVMQYLLEQGIHTRRSTMSAHMEEPYQQAWPLGSLPESERVSTAGITLPMFPTMSREQASYVAKTLIRALSR